MREIYLDIAKGISILLVILGHIIQYTSLNNSFLNNEIWIFIYSFHVPLFMHISGQLLFKSLQKNKKNITYYNTPYGSLLVGIDAYRVDVQEISGEIKKGLDIRFMENMDEVLELALCSQK